MELASEYVQWDSSDEEDYVEMSDVEADCGLQTFSAAVADDESTDEENEEEEDEDEEDDIDSVAVLYSAEDEELDTALALSAMVEMERAAPIRSETPPATVAALRGARHRTTPGGRAPSSARAMPAPRKPRPKRRGRKMLSTRSPLLEEERAAKREAIGTSLRSAIGSRDAAHKKKRGKSVASRIRQKVNARVIAVDLSTVGSAALLATGDAFQCSNALCGAILSKHDSLQDIGEAAPSGEETKDDSSSDEDGLKLWVCEFCGNHNRLQIESEEFPLEESMDFLLEPALEEKSGDGRVTVFVVDTSGSMCVSQPVAGGLRTKAVDSDMEDMRAFVDDGSDQFLPGQKRGVTWLSRLALVQTAIESQIRALAKERSAHKIALCSFADGIHIWGTGGELEAQFVGGDKLKDMAKLQQIGANCHLRRGVAEMQHKLIEKLYSLKESGQTCLGPALVVSIAMAAKCRPAPSSVVLATDGLANVGLGALDALSDAELDAAEHWYESVAQWALECGVTVNIVSIGDAECRLENVGKVADATGGEVLTVDPTSLRALFQGLLAKSVIATHTQATVLLHPLCAFAKRDSDESSTTVPKPKSPLIPKTDILAPAIVFDTKGGLPMDPSSRILTKSAMPAISERMSHEPGAEGIVHSDLSAMDCSSKLEPVISTVAVEKQVRDVGNVLEDDESSKLFFEFEMRKEMRAKYADLEAVTMQVQVAYTRADGAKLLRVITRSLPLADRSTVMRSLKMGVVASHALRRAAELCEEGDYEEARAMTYASGVWMARTGVTDDDAHVLRHYMQRNMELDKKMQREEMPAEVRDSAFSSRAHRRKARARRRSDDFSSAMFGAKKGRKKS